MGKIIFFASSFIVLLITSTFITHISAQTFNPTVTINSNQNGYVEYSTITPKKTGLFYLLDDGFFSTKNHCKHQFEENSNGYDTGVFFNKPYDAQPPTLKTINTGNTTNGSNANAKVKMANEVNIGTSWNPVNGIENYFIFTFENKSNNIESGCVEFYYNDNDLKLNSAQILEYNNWVSNRSISNVSISGFNKKVKWNFDSLEIGEQRILYIPMKSQKKRAYKLKVGGKKNLNCDSSGGISSFNFMNSLYPHDPNTKTVYPECLYAQLPQGQKLTYTITFQNDGHAPVNKVVLVDLLDPFHLDLSSINFIDSEYNYFFSMNGNELKITFPDINLPGINQPDHNYTYDQTRSYITFEVCTISDIQNFTCIDNLASIYFDSQPVIKTNTATSCTSNECSIPMTTCFPVPTPTKTKIINNNKKVLVYPNPNAGEFILNTLNFTSIEISIYNNLGIAIPFKQSTINDDINIDITDVPNGIYFLVAKNNKNQIIKRIIKH